MRRRKPLSISRFGNIDLIAMTSHGFSGIKAWVFGSTTESAAWPPPSRVLLIPAAKT